MHLLVTNDDGLDSVFLHELVHALLAAGHRLLVAAPAGEQSWIGAAKTRHRPLRSRQADRGFGCPTWSVDGTPSDCVNIALAHLLPADAPAIDGVVSGINIGRNTSLAFIIASGTIGGAWEGALHGLPAAALSQDIPMSAFARLREAGGKPEPELHDTLRLTAQHAARIAPELLGQTTPRTFTVHNLNFPYPAAPTRPCAAPSPRTTSSRASSPPRCRWRPPLRLHPRHDLTPPEMVTDVATVAAGAISHTVLDYRRLGH
jgi:5'-nucleotidase